MEWIRMKNGWVWTRVFDCLYRIRRVLSLLPSKRACIELPFYLYITVVMRFSYCISYCPSKKSAFQISVLKVESSIISNRPHRSNTCIFTLFISPLPMNITVF